MRAVLDESVPKGLSRLLAAYGVEVDAFPVEWKGLKNGVLLSRLEAESYVVLLTCDKNLAFQQRIKARRLAVVVLPMQKLAGLNPLAKAIAEAVNAVGQGQVAALDDAGRFIAE